MPTKIPNSENLASLPICRKYRASTVLKPSEKKTLREIITSTAKKMAVSGKSTTPIKSNKNKGKNRKVAKAIKTVVKDRRLAANASNSIIHFGNKLKKIAPEFELVSEIPPAPKTSRRKFIKLTAMSAVAAALWRDAVALGGGGAGSSHFSSWGIGSFSSSTEIGHGHLSGTTWAMLNPSPQPKAGLSSFMQYQNTNEWCAFAVTSSIGQLLRPTSNFPSQCQLAGTYHNSSLVWAGCCSEDFYDWYYYGVGVDIDKVLYKCAQGVFTFGLSGYVWVNFKGVLGDLCSNSFNELAELNVIRNLVTPSAATPPVITPVILVIDLADYYKDVFGSPTYTRQLIVHPVLHAIAVYSIGDTYLLPITRKLLGIEISTTYVKVARAELHDPFAGVWYGNLCPETGMIYPTSDSVTMPSSYGTPAHDLNGIASVAVLQTLATQQTPP